MALDASSVSAGLVTASGRARGVFENQLPLVLRGSDGTVIAQRTVRVSGGRWSGKLTYRSTRAQAGTFEAVVTSAKDGALICIVQVRVALPAAPRVAVNVLSQYPHPCLRPVRRASGAGQVATLNTGTLTIASPADGTPIVIPYTPPTGGSYQGGVPLVGWSPDGRYVAARFGDVWTAAGESAGKLCGGFAPGGKILIFWAAEGASVGADGVALRGIDTAHGNGCRSIGGTYSGAGMTPSA